VALCWRPAPGRCGRDSRSSRHCSPAATSVKATKKGASASSLLSTPCTASTGGGMDVGASTSQISAVLVCCATKV
jgi:hypothetical protein